MAIQSFAKGSRSAIGFAEESTLGTLHTTSAYKGLLFSSESIVESADSVRSNDIRADRAVSAIRTGNLANGGSFTCDFGPSRYFTLWRHLLGAADPTPVAITPTVLTTGLAVTRGTVYSVPSNTLLFTALTTATYTKVGATVTDDFTSATSGDEITIGGVRFYAKDKGAATGYATRTIVGASALLTSGLSVEKRIIGGTTGLYVAFSGGRVNSVELTIPQKGIIQTVWDLLFLKAVSGSAAQGNAGAFDYSHITDEPASGYDAAISWAGSGYASTRPLREASLSISNGIDPETYIIGARDRKELPEGERSMTARITSYFQDSVEYTYFKNEQTVTMQFSIISEGAQFIVDLGSVRITGPGSPTVSGPGTITCSYDVSAFKGPGVTNDIQIKMIDLV